MKKWFALLLVVSMLVTCLVGCGGQEPEEPVVETVPETEIAEPDTAPEESMPHEAAPEDPVPEEPESDAVSGGVKVRMGETYITDLDGDGQEDTIVCSYTQEDSSQKLSVVINGVECNDNNTRHWDYIQDYYYVVDLYGSDSYREIAILDEGPSSDPISVFYYYHDTILEECGQVAGFVGSDQVTVHGDSTVSAIKRLQILQTWWGHTTWVLNENHALEELPNGIYLPTANSYVNVTLTGDLQAFTLMDTSSTRETIPAGTELTLTGTDNDTWVVVTADNNTYWIYLPDGWSIDNGSGEAVWAGDLMDGLVYAD